MHVRPWFGGVAALLTAPALAPAGPAGVQFFEQKIRPVLVTHCYQCHSARTARPKGGLVVDTRDGLLKGGRSGPALVPGKPGESLILKALRHDDEIAMPPKEKLGAEVVADFERWVRMGAPDPRGGRAGGPAPAAVDVEAGRAFWAFRPPRRHPVPAVKDTAWPRTFVDCFLLAALEARGVKPAADADRRTLLRRLSLDLTGLPPTPEEADAFVNDPAADAYEKVVDRLLASPAFGERWGRHWLDVARYADSNGKDENLTFHEAFRYRDYVLDAFNKDKPYDRFVVEQLAGDLLPTANQAEADERLTATGFLVVGPKVLADRDFEKRRMDVVDEQIDTVGKAFLGLTLGCARCHDHKFDPVPTKDYYALAGIFNSTRTLDGIKLGNAVVSGWMLRPLGGPDGEAKLAAHRAHQKKLAALAADIKKLKGELKLPKGTPKADAQARLKRLEEEKKLKAAAPPRPPLVMAVRDEARVANCRVNLRGDPHQLGDEVPRGFLTVARVGPPAALPRDKSGRLELARWVASADNPLTARVMVNRVWLHLFGAGLVRTPDNFGTQGERPTHPELLDELALRFVADGWSVKKLVRLLVRSHAYRLSGAGDARAARADPENRLFGRASRRRVEAEVVRDSILTVSGRLDRTPGGPVVAHLGERAIDNDSKGGVPTDGNVRRSVYLPVIRNDLPPALEAFDFADPEVTVGRRDVTTVATQALYLLNSPFVLGQARAAAGRLLALPCDDAGRVGDLYRRALGRAPTAEETRKALDFVARFRGTVRGGPGADVEAWGALCLAVFGCTEFRFVE
jgi:hypothetical protein